MPQQPGVGQPYRMKLARVDSPKTLPRQDPFNGTKSVMFPPRPMTISRRSRAASVQVAQVVLQVCAHGTLRQRNHSAITFRGVAGIFRPRVSQKREAKKWGIYEVWWHCSEAVLFRLPGHFSRQGHYLHRSTPERRAFDLLSAVRVCLSPMPHSHHE